MFYNDEKEDQMLELRESLMLDAVTVIADENDPDDCVRMLTKLSLQPSMVQLAKDLKANVLPDSPNTTEFFMRACSYPASFNKVELLKLVQLSALNEFLEEGTYVAQSKETNHPAFRVDSPGLGLMTNKTCRKDPSCLPSWKLETMFTSRNGKMMDGSHSTLG